MEEAIEVGSTGQQLRNNDDELPDCDDDEELCCPRGNNCTCIPKANTCTGGFVVQPVPGVFRGR
jgi:hypothetical protein